jgi:hypothetical protein
VSAYVLLKKARADVRLKGERVKRRKEREQKKAEAKAKQ